MTRFHLPLAMALTSLVALPLAGCASLGGSPTGSASLEVAKGFVAAETGFDAAVQTADIAITSGQLKPAAVKAIKADVDKGYTYIVAGRMAVTAANAADLIAATSSLTTLVADLTTLTKG